jgi:hypothetical protein
LILATDTVTYGPPQEPDADEQLWVHIKFGDVFGQIVHKPGHARDGIGHA